MTTYQERHISIWTGLARLAQLTNELIGVSPELENRKDITQQIARIEAAIAQWEAEDS